MSPPSSQGKAGAPRAVRRLASRWRVVLWSALVVAATIAGLLWWSAQPSRRAGRPAADASERSGAAASSEAASRASQPGAGSVPLSDLGGLSVDSGGTLTLRAEALSETQPLEVVFAIPAEAYAGEPLPSRIVGPDGAVLELPGAVPAAGGGGVRLVIEAGWLRHGRHIVEVRTAERSPLPLRRFAIEVR
jgi:hypothetical protein